MYPYKRVVIAQHERGLHLKNRSLTAVLEPGVYRILDPLARVEVHVHNITVTEFTHPQADVFVKSAPELVARHFHVVHLADGQAGLVYKDEVLADVLAPGARRLYWKEPVAVRIEVLDVAKELEVPETVRKLLARPREDLALTKARNRYVQVAEVADKHVGLLIVDGQLQRTLAPGLYAYWTFNRTVKVEQVDQRLQAMDIQGQEILTKDKVTLRVNLVASYRITDPVTARGTLDKFAEYLYRELQFGLRKAFATRTLDALLETKGQLDQAIHDYVREQALAHGITVTGVGVKDLILPGDMRELLNGVVEAEKVAQANVIKRREETAATRSLLNTAKLMDENPTLLRLKELEALEKVAEKVDRLTVFGGLDGVLKDTVRIGVKAE
jgi:regulator of protease activity HflC (stomatin/prohibitin superfamily)